MHLRLQTSSRGVGGLGCKFGFLWIMRDIKVTTIQGIQVVRVGDSSW